MKYKMWCSVCEELGEKEREKKKTEKSKIQRGRRGMYKV